ncbi:hypothetical protein Bca52824_076380 [Brassica carinata]|uniref:Uncharacterized protein n=3 Tax=Brassica TaxID=3705 RepID=A0A8X7TXG2_BRACI|nr:hypothetical protein Bca52824_076380 [Brassica carinata]CAF2109299.1 unnamed protein product [Brassica napus]VDD56262.1 unnamed protein product [Brassica oleracea]
MIALENRLLPEYRSVSKLHHLLWLFRYRRHLSHPTHTSHLRLFVSLLKRQISNANANRIAGIFSKTANEKEKS